ncbi:hypothetical protein Aperf_G00000098699 [Anoplocephala perfoliata]
MCIPLLYILGFLSSLCYSYPNEHTINLPDAVVIEEKLVEELPIGHAVLNLNKAIAIHDSHRNSSHYPLSSESGVFTLIPAEQYEYFRISPNHDLVVIKRIDREAICSANDQEGCLLRLQLNALQMGDPNSRTRLRTVFMRFILEDINDNRPICQPPPNALKDEQYPIPTIEVLETAQLNEVLASWTVTDADTPKYGIHGFRQLTTSPHDFSGDQFSLDISGAILTQRPWSKVTFQLRLNRPFKKQSGAASANSKLLGEYLIKYIVWDSPDEPSDYNPSHRTACHIRVHVLDVNNHSPEWVVPQQFQLNQPVQIDLKEGSSGSTGRNNHILKLEAKDADIGPNAFIQYHLMMGDDKLLEADDLLNNLLYLDSRTGVLRIRRYPLDYEAIARQLPLKHISPDGTEAAGIRFFVKAVDSPKDESQQRSSPVGEIVLYVHDVNDSPPKITVLPVSIVPSFSPSGKKTLTVRENLPALEPIATVTVEDPDTGVGGRVECDLLEGPSKNASMPNFRLIKTTFPEWSTKQRNVGYQILTASPLDRELQNSHELRLICVDGEGASNPNEKRLTSVVSIFVRVLDENDCAPKASSENEFLSDGSTVACRVVENVKQGTKICQLKAFDADEGENAAVEWTGGIDVPSWLRVDTSTGWLIASGPGGPDREAAERHNFSVIATDGRRGGKRLSTTIAVSLEVTDVNDHAPEIGSFFYFTISESAPPGTIIGCLNATDRDKAGTENSALTYTISGMRPLESNGKSGPWSLPSNGVQKNKPPVVGSVTDIFLPRNNSSAKENALSAGHMNRNHSDHVQLPHFRDSKWCLLNEETGVISVGPDGLDREQLESFELLVEVVDGGRRETGRSDSTHQLTWNTVNSRLTAQTTVQINIQDENDNEPKFIFPKSDSVGKVSLACGDIQHLPRVILQIVANDSDKAPNSELEYSLRFDNETQQLIASRRHEENKTAMMPDAPWFEIEPRSGEISLVAVDEFLSRCHSPEKNGKRELGRYGLIVIATDKGEPRLSATASLQIRFTTSDMEPTDATSMTLLNSGGRGSSEFTSTMSASESGSASRYESIISSAEVRPHWMTNEGNGGRDEGSSFEAAEPRLTDRFAIFSSPAAFWAATICLAVATTILLGLICTFVLMAFKRRGKPDREVNELPSTGLYTTAAVETATSPGSACLSIDASALPSGDSKATLRLAPYPGSIFEHLLSEVVNGAIACGHGRQM